MMSYRRNKVLGSLGAIVLAMSVAGQSFAEGPSVSGFVDFGYNYNFNGQRTNNFRTFDHNANSFTLQNGEVVVSGKSKSDVSYRVDVDYGYDASVIHSGVRNAPGGPTTPGALVGTDAMLQVDLQQAYFSANCPITKGLWTFGKFVTLHGAEVIEAKDNNNISRGLLFNYAIPFTHTGIKFDKSLGNLALTGAVVNGWDNVQDNNSAKTLHGMAMYTMPKVMVALGGTYGPEQNQTATSTLNGKSRSLVDALVKVTPSNALTLIANIDWGVDEGAAFTAKDASDTTANWTGLGLHANYVVNDMWSVAGRFETLDDDRLQSDYDANGSVDELKVNSLTFTLQHKMNDVIARLEYRVDSASDKVFLDDKGSMADKSQNTIGLQWIYAF